MTPEVAGWRLRVFESLGSTSDLCRTLAASGEPDRLAIRANRQTAGRGSRGRGWLSEPGNLALSMLLRPTDRIRDAGMWALLAGVAVAESLGHPGVSLKWPNDILLEGAKLGGILIDTAADHEGGFDWLVIGVGINLKAAPAIEGRVVAGLDGSADPADIAQRILHRIDHWQAARAASGWDCVRSAWLGHALPIGSPTTLRQQDLMIAGSFAGLGVNGSLLLQTEEGVRAFSSGEIWIGPRETPTNAKEPPSC